MIALRSAVGLVLVGISLQAIEPPTAPWVDRLEPFGAAVGETVEVRIVGERFADGTVPEFSDAGLRWVETVSQDDKSIQGRVQVGKGVPLGPHLVVLRGSTGRSNGRMFYVDGLPSTREVEPNSTAAQAQAIQLKPQTLHGALIDLADLDMFRFRASAGERWVFDVRSIEYGAFLEAELALLDADGREVAFNDDKDDYLETPFLEHVFEADGEYLLKLDQYRGPQRVNCANNCGYMLRMSQAPAFRSLSPLGGRRGSHVALTVRGSGLDSVESVLLKPVRGAEYYRLTFPYTMPLQPRGLGGDAIAVTITKRSASVLQASVNIPDDAALGLWRVWLDGPSGAVDGVAFEISDASEFSESQTPSLGAGTAVVNGLLAESGEDDVYRVEARAGRMLHFSILAVQMGLPEIDPVLELFDADGKLLAEHDDLMTGQGTVIGNPDPSLFYRPEQDSDLRLVVRDRTGRGGPEYVYRLRADDAPPGFTLMSDPENPVVERGGTAQVGVLMMRDPGFEEGVEVWGETDAGGVTIEPAQIRADQFFGPSADGDNVIIPEAFLKVTSAPDAQPGEYRIRIFGRSPDGRIVEAYSTLWIGAPRMRNDVRRPLPEIVLSVVEPTPATVAEGRDSQ